MEPPESWSSNINALHRRSQTEMSTFPTMNAPDTLDLSLHLPAWNHSKQRNESEPHVPERQQPQSGPPDGGREAWTQVFASFLINMNVYGLVNAFGQFQHYYESDYLTSYSSSEISWIGTVQASLTLFIGALAGPIFDKGYFMITLRFSAITLVFSWMMLSLSTQYYQVSRLCSAASLYQ